MVTDVLDAARVYFIMSSTICIHVQFTSKLGKRSKMIKTGRHVIQSWYLARISRSEMRMVTTCPGTKSPHESQLFYGSTTEFNGSDAAEK